MSTQTVEEPKTSPSKASNKMLEAKSFTPEQIQRAEEKAIKLWQEGKAKGSKAIFTQADAVATFLGVHRGDENDQTKGVALESWLKTHMEISYATATKWDSIHNARTFLAQLNLPTSWTTYYEASRLFEDATAEQGNVIVKAFRTYTANHLPDEITADLIRKIRATLPNDLDTLTVSEDGKIEVANPKFNAAEGGVKSMPVMPLKTPGELKDEKRKAAESKAELSPEEQRAIVESELQEFDPDGNDVILSDPKKLFADMKAEQEQFHDLQFKIAMKRLMREFGIKNSEVEIKSKAVAA